MRRVGLAFVIVAAFAAACGAHHTSMHEAVRYAACGDRCGDIAVELSAVRHADDYATADVTTRPAGHEPGAHVLLRRVRGDWHFIDAWTSLGDLTCADVARQMRVPESVLRRLEVCGSG